MKKLFALMLALMLALTCASAMAEITLTYAEVNPVEGTIVGDMALAFKEKVEELSGGEIKIDIQASGVLGNEEQIITGILSGDNTVDVARISTFALNQYGCARSVFLSLPFVFESEEHYWKFVESDLAKEFLAEPQQIGLPLRGLCFAEEGFRHFFFKTEVKTIEEMKGMKIRVSQDTIMPKLVESLGAYATSVSFGELYTALQSGVVDAAEQPLVNYLKNSFQEPCPYLLKDGHTLGAIEIIVADSGWNKLTAEQQGWLQEAADYASKVVKDDVVVREAEATATLLEKGCTIIEVEDKTPYVEATQKMVQDAIKGQEAVYEAIQALK